MVSKFKAGIVCLSAEVNMHVAADQNFAAFVMTSLARHLRGDWGDVCEEDRKENEFSMNNRLRLFLVYKNPENPAEKISIITEADRSATIALFPDEY